MWIFLNSKQLLKQELKKLNAAQNIAETKSLKGIQATLSSNIGLSQSAGNLVSVYKDLKDQEIIGIALSMPIFDGGVRKGCVKMAQAHQLLVHTEIEQEEGKYFKDLLIKVLRFNNQIQQCEISRKAMKVADERYKITCQLFENASITVTDLNIAQNEQKNASNEFVAQLGLLWNSYFEIRKLTLYDFITEKNLSAEFTEFDKIIK